MTVDLHTSALSELQCAGIIHADHVRRALADPDYAELADNSDPAHHLVWLVCSDILGEDELRHAVRVVNDTYAGDELERHNRTLGGALVLLKELREKFNNACFDTLVSENIITSTERGHAVARSSGDHVLASPAAALAWMALSITLGSIRVGQIRASAGTGSAERAAIVTDALQMIDSAAAARGDIFPGPRWMWIAAPLLFAGFLAWMVLKPASVPNCTDPDVKRTLNSMLLMAGIDARVDAAMSGNMDAKMASPTVVSIREVGFAAEPRIRGCVGKLRADGAEIPYAFTISRSATEKGEYAVIGAEPRIVEARFGNLDGDGKFLHNAQPLGRAEVERAFRAGVESGALSSSAYANLRTKRTSALSTEAPERTREIAEIEPLAPCREIKPGVAYACRLLVERNDALMALFGGGTSTLIDQEFTFERDSAGAPWRVSPGFADELAKGIVGARLNPLAP